MTGLAVMSFQEAMGRKNAGHLPEEFIQSSAEPRALQKSSGARDHLRFESQPGLVSHNPQSVPQRE
jgi:hypothetical protein